MSDARTWAVFAFAQPASVALFFSLLYQPIRFATWCHFPWMTTRLFGVTGLGLFALAAGLACTFATEAFRNKKIPLLSRIVWALATLIAGPITIPLYWFVFLRD